MTLLFSILFLFFGSIHAQILLPPNPQPKVPHTPSRQEADDEIQSRIDRRKEEDQKNIPDPGKKRLEKLNEETLKPRPMNLVVSVAIMYPQLTVGGPRKRYVPDLTSHALMGYRLSQEKPPEVWQMWIGGRVAPFSGTGVHKAISGRFGLLYLGPAIGLGRITQGILSEGFNPAAEGGGESDYAFSTRFASIVWCGIAAVSRSSHTIDPAEEAPPGDLDQARFAFDTPGAWVELHLTQVFFGALGWNFHLGSQWGEQKLFNYIGVGFSGWN